MTRIVDDLRVERVGRPLVQGIGRLDIVVAVEEDVRDIVAVISHRVGDDHGLARRLAHARLEARFAKHGPAGFRSFQAGCVISRVGRDALDAQQVEKPCQCRVVIGVNLGENVVHLAHCFLFAPYCLFGAPSI